MSIQIKDFGKTTAGQPVKVGILANDTMDEEAIRNVIDNTGYKVLSVHSESYKKKGLFHRG